MAALEMMSVNERAFLDMIAHSEIGAALLAESDDGYNVLVGSTLSAPLLFSSYADHPNVFNKSCNSTAAGRYQLLHRYWVAYKHQLTLPDFSPTSQDQIALQQIRECRALDDVNDGGVETAIAKCAHIWASLPGAGYGQHENRLSALIKVYTDAGGRL